MGINSLINKDNKRIPPNATPEQVEKVEKHIYDSCSPYLDKIDGMASVDFMELFEKAISFDLERGLLPGQLPHIIYEHTQAFLDFEMKLWGEMNDWIEKNEEEFYKLLNL